jgi:hypothetical protein
MTTYLQFETTTGQPVLVEIDDQETSEVDGVQKAGVSEKVGEAVVAAASRLEAALGAAISRNAEAFIEGISQLSERPAEAELSFALKVTGELSNVAVGKAGSDVNYNIRLVWKSDKS